MEADEECRVSQAREGGSHETSVYWPWPPAALPSGDGGRARRRLRHQRRRRHGADRAGRRIRPGRREIRRDGVPRHQRRRRRETAASSSPTRATRRARATSPSTPRRSSFRSKKVPVIIGGIISSVSIPILTSVTGAGRRRAGLARLLVADADRARRARARPTASSSAPSPPTRCRARPPAKYALDQGLKKLVDHPRQQRFRRQHGRRVHARPTRRSAARSSPSRPTTRTRRAIRPR